MAMPRRTTKTGLLWPLLLLLIAAAASLGCDRGRAEEAAAEVAALGPSPAQVAEAPEADGGGLPPSAGPATQVNPEPATDVEAPAPGDEAKTGTDTEAIGSPATDPRAAEREAERQRELARREAELAERERALARREAAAVEAARRAPAPEPLPAVTPGETAEPVAETPAAVEDAGEAEDWRAVRATEGRVWAEVDSSPAPPETVLVTLPVGTELEVEILDRLSSRDNVAGDRFRARVVRDVEADGLVAIPAGTEVRGTVVEADSAPEIGGRASMALAFEQLVLASGETVAITASLAELGRSQTGKDAAAIGGGALAGAILGRAVGDKHKKRGTVIGAILGAAVGSAVAAKRPGDAVEIDAGTVVRLRLDEWARVTAPAHRK